MDTEYAAAHIEDHIGFRINWTKYHDTKIRSGHLVGNKFKVLISDIKMQKRQIKERVDAIFCSDLIRSSITFFNRCRLCRCAMAR